MRKLLIFAIFIVLGLFGCSDDNIGMDGMLYKDAAFASELKSLPESLEIDGSTLALSTLLWRDFTPETGGSKGTLLESVTNLYTIDSLPIPESIVLSKQYLVNGNEIWEAEYFQWCYNTEYDCVITGYVPNGPRWRAQILVDVITEFKSKGVIYRILAKEQFIYLKYY